MNIGADLTRARPHHIMDGLPVISRRHVLQARCQLKPGRGIFGTDGLNAEVPQCLSMEGNVLLWCILSVVTWTSASPKTWTLSLAACLSKDRAMTRAVRHKANRWPQVCLDGDFGQGLQRLLDIDSPGKITDLCGAPSCCALPRARGHQCADMVLTEKLIIEKSGVWPNRPLATMKLDMRKISDQTVPQQCCTCPSGRQRRPGGCRGNSASNGGGESMLVVGGHCCREVDMERVVGKGDRSPWTCLCLCSAI